MANIAKVMREEIARGVSKAMRGTGLPGEVKKLSGRVSRLEKRLEALEARMARAVASPASPRARGRADGRKLRFSPGILKGVREKIGVTQQELAKLLGVSGNAVWQWEAGRARPRLKHLEEMRKLRTIGKREAKKRLKQK